jgi:hypothetical protein
MVVIHRISILCERLRQFASPPRTGEGGIRTPGTVTRTLVFETSPFSRSGTSPVASPYGTVRFREAHEHPTRTAPMVKRANALRAVDDSPPIRYRRKHMRCGLWGGFLTHLSSVVRGEVGRRTRVGGAPYRVYFLSDCRVTMRNKTSATRITPPPARVAGGTLSPTARYVQTGTSTGSASVISAP